ncbi:NAD(P)-binding protein [Suillus lakei]|nr:NAD(P)-binding protein [Suillus lakei]
MTESKVWLVTGSSSGFGRSMTKLLLNNGNKVVATLRRKEALSELAELYPSSQLLIVQMDVVKSSEVAAAFAKAKEVFGRVDVVFNNAGMTIIGEMESLSDEEARRIVEVNFWGASNVTREAIRMFREVNRPIGGRLLQVSSLLGLAGRPAMSYYSASKHALEGFSESIAQELDPAWDIQVESDYAQCEIQANACQITIIEPASSIYQPRLPGSKFREWASRNAGDGDPDKAVVVMEKLIHLDEAPMRLPLHRFALSVGRAKAASLIETVDKYESWSEDVYIK